MFQSCDGAVKLRFCAVHLLFELCYFIFSQIRNLLRMPSHRQEERTMKLEKYLENRLVQQVRIE